MIPPKDLLPRLREEASNMDKILEQVKYRAEWLKYQEAQRRKEEEELERERVAYAQIDWHDFVVVETVDYQQFEVGNFPAPTTPDEVGARVLMQVIKFYKFYFILKYSNKIYCFFDNFLNF